MNAAPTDAPSLSAWQDGSRLVIGEANKQEAWIAAEARVAIDVEEVA